MARRKSRRGGTRFDLRSAAAANRSRSVTPLSPPRRTWETGLPGEIAHRAHLPALVEEERIDRAEIEVHDLVAGGARVGHERAVRLRAALVAQEHLGALVAHEERGGRAELRREPGEDRPLADRQQSRARPRELEHDRARGAAPRRAARCPRARAESARARRRARRRTAARAR